MILFMSLKALFLHGGGAANAVCFIPPRGWGKEPDMVRIKIEEIGVDYVSEYRVSGTRDEICEFLKSLKGKVSKKVTFDGEIETYINSTGERLYSPAWYANA